MKGLTLEELSLQGVHEDVGIGGGHLGAHCRSLYLLVDVCVERENIARENYVSVGGGGGGGGRWLVPSQPLKGPPSQPPHAYSSSFSPKDILPVDRVDIQGLTQLEVWQDRCATPSAARRLL